MKENEEEQESLAADTRYTKTKRERSKYSS